jgi:hypothetical protein
MVEEYDDNQMTMDSVNKDIKGESSKENGKKKRNEQNTGQERI